MFGFGFPACVRNSSSYLCVVIDRSPAADTGMDGIKSLARFITPKPTSFLRSRKRLWAGALSLCVLFVNPFTPTYGQGGSPNPQQGAVSSVPFESNLNLAAQGNVQAQLAVAKAYNDGIGVKPNPRSAFKWFQAASDEGDIEAKAWLGSLYLFGMGVTQDVSRALELIQPAADSSDPVGLRFLGVMYQNGQGVAQDYSKAFQLYSKAMSLNDPNAFDRLGRLYYGGLGVNKSMRKALALFTEGAGLGDSWAQLDLGLMYESGHVRPDHTLAPLGPGNTKPTLRPDYPMALKLYTQSAAQGNRVAAYQAGVLYEAGSGVTQNYAQAFQYYKQSASKGYSPAFVALGKLHELGLGTSVNLLHAYVAYSVAARQEDAEAADRLQSLIRRLTPDQLARAKVLLQRFLDSSQTGHAE
jgi:uncharacterized protein